MKRRFVTAVCVVALAALSMSIGGCTKPDVATQILTREGYESIEISGYAFFGCGEDDWYRTGFNAVKNGQSVKGVVCSGALGKGSTVRTFD